MFIHIDKIVAHAQSWLAKEKYAVESEVGKQVQSLVAHIAEKSQEEFAVEMLQQKGYGITVPPVNEPPPGAVLVDQAAMRAAN